MELKINNLSVCYDKKPILKSFTAEFKQGITCLLGENGSGKTTMLKAIYQLVKFRGEIFHNKNLLNKNYILENISYLSQHHGININLSVLEVVLLGNYSKLCLTGNKDLKQQALDLLDTLGILQLQHSRVQEISGGQRKLVYLAQALLKKPKILLLDEPCNSLDIYNQINLFEFIKKLKGLIIIMAMHDINLTSRYADKIILLNNGEKKFDGMATELSPSNINNTYNIIAEKFTINDSKQYFFKLFNHINY